MTDSTLLQASSGAVMTIWITSLVLGLVVTVVVVFLLERIKKTAVAILNGASAIWTHGQLVANNTVQLPVFLPITNRVAGKILQTSQQIRGAAQAIEQHAEGCPGCPDCLLNDTIV